MNTIEQDAREFGLHVKQGGWRLGLLVARNVEKGKGEGGGGTDGSHRADRRGEKKSARAFAADAGTPNGDRRVTRYFDAWEKAAEAGHVPAAATLSPGEDVELDVEKLPDWGDFYDASNAGGYNGGENRTPTVAGIKKALGKLTEESRTAVVAEAMRDTKVARNVLDDRDAEDAIMTARVYQAQDRSKSDRPKHVTQFPVKKTPWLPLAKAMYQLHHAWKVFDSGQSWGLLGMDKGEARVRREVAEIEEAINMLKRMRDLGRAYLTDREEVAR